jgi:uncharacterized protein YneF (UPF0154 family)
MAVQIVLNLVVYLVFVAIGYLISKRITPPTNAQGWVVWVILAILAGGICVSGRAFNITGVVDLHINDMLQALGIGILIGFVIAASGKNKAKDNLPGTK